jgi:RNA polymerase sigma factor (sigma-70 family)
VNEAVLRELDGLRALARSLAHGDAGADDLLQDAAVAALEHPPPPDRPARAWLALVLRNRRRMDLRAAARRRAREEAVAADAETAGGEASLERAHALARLSRALIALDEPFRATVIARYFDGRSAAEIARASRVPPGTVRWRLRTALARLRAALDDAEPRWRRAFVPLAGATVKTKTTTLSIAILLFLLGLGALVLVLALRGGGDPAPPGPAAVVRGGPIAPPPVAAAGTPVPREEAPRDPSPGQGRARVEQRDLPGGAVSGRVINWSTGDGVAGAELTFTGDAGATTVRSGTAGEFELAPPAPGRFALTAASAPGFLPYAPELLHSTIHVDVARDRAVRGITVFLFPALEYGGRVVDERGAPVAGAKVRLLGTPTGEQAIEKLETEWTTDRDGAFRFHAADDAVLEAVLGSARGWALVDDDVVLTRRLVIRIGQAPARDATIAGRVVDEAGRGLADVLVRAEPETPRPSAEVRATAFAVTGADGGFLLEGLDRGAYRLAAEAEGRAPAGRGGIAGGARDVTLVLDVGLPLAGAVAAADGDAVPAYTLLVMARDGARRELVLARSIVEPGGRFEVRVPPGEYDLIAAASGWAPSTPVTAAAGTKDARLVVTAGATLRGRVVAADGGAGISYARIMREAPGGGASAQPANAGTVTRADGSFELTGLPPGPVSITVAAGGYHPKIEAGLTATDGAQLGPLVVALAALREGEKPSLELVGIGCKLSADGDGLRVEAVFPESGGAAAGIAAGDLVIAVDGVPVAQLGLAGAIARIRGVVGTRVSVTLRRGDQPVTLVVERKKIRT